MKYTIAAINQIGIDSHGLSKTTDMVDWGLLDYIFEWQLNPKAKKYEDLVWLNYKHLINEMPLLGLNTKSSVSNRIKKLKGLGLIQTYQCDIDMRLYIKTTELYYQITKFSCVNSEEHPFLKMNTPVHSEEHPVHSEEHPVPENEHSTVIPINSNIINSKTIEQNISDLKKSPVKKLSPDALLLKKFGITDDDLISDFIKHRKSKRAPITDTALKSIQREALIAGILFCDAIRIAIEKNWQGFEADWYFKSINSSNSYNRKEPAKRDYSKLLNDLENMHDSIESTSTRV